MSEHIVAMERIRRAVQMRQLAKEAAEKIKANQAYMPTDTILRENLSDDGSTDESIDVLVDAKSLPIPVSTACCDGGKMPETRVYQARCEDASPQTTHFERLDSLPFRAGLICEQAAKIVGGARMGAYGKPEDNFERIAILWGAWECVLETVPAGQIPPKADVAIRNILQKLARIAATPDHTDSWRDIAGYADCGARCAGCDPTK